MAKSKAEKALEQKLNGLGDNWDEAKENPKGGFQNWEDGKYQCQLIEADLCESKAGRLQIKWVFQNMDSEAVDTHMIFDGLDPAVSEDCLAWLQKRIEDLGFDYPAKISALPKLIEKMVAADIKVQLKLQTKAGNNGGEFQNTYVDHIIEE